TDGDHDDDDGEDRARPASLRAARIDLAAPDALDLFGSADAEEASDGGGRRHTVGPRIERQLKNILRRADLARRETGVHALWFGWPLLKISSTEGDDAQTVLAPLFLFPASVSPSAQRRSLVHIARDDGAGEPRWNSVLQEWLSQKLGINVDPPPSDLTDWRAPQFLEWIDKAMAVFRPAPTLDTAGGMVAVPTRLSDERPSTTGELLHAGALGLYRWQNAAVLRDLEEICEETSCPEPLDGFLEGRPRPQPPADEPEEFDRHLVTDADYSQARVVWASRDAEGLVMHGPPGTGKSQTIVNVVADALSRGERVLMVSQKDAATRVVHNRLKQAGLGGLCLEVHDADNDRLSVFRAIRTQVDELPDRAPSQPGQRKILAEEIEALEAELDAFAIAMRVADEDLGIAYGEVQAVRGQASERFPEVRPLEELPPEIASIDREGLARLESRLRELGRLFRAAGLPDTPWRKRVKDVEHRVGFQRDLAGALDRLKERSLGLDEAVEAIRAAVPTKPVGMIAGDPERWVETVDSCLDVATEIASQPAEMRGEIVSWLEAMRSDGAPGSGDEAPSAFLDRAEHALQAVAESDRHPPDAAWRTALRDASDERLRTVLEACAAVDRGLKRSWLARLFSGTFRKARRVLAAVRQDATGDLLADVAASGLRHGEALRCERAVLQAAAECHPTKTRSFEDVSAAKAWIRLVHAAGEIAGRASALVRAAPPLTEMVERACGGSPPGAEDDALRAMLRTRGERLPAAIAALRELGAFFETAEIERRERACREGGSLRPWIESVEENRTRLPSLAAWEAELESLDAALRVVVHGCYEATREHTRSNESAETFGERWATIATVSVASRWDAHLRRRHPVLGRVTAAGHGERIEKLRQALAKKRRLESKAILATWGRRQQER
ncbi:MAG: AAA domain-containing protein, partial [Planctomycetota bacterium]